MNIKKLLPTILLISVMGILSACAPEVPSEEPIVPTEDVVPKAPPEVEAPYPYPAPGEESVLQPGDSAESYPSPQEAIPTWDPYPAMEIVENIGNRDLSEAITSAEFTVRSSDGGLPMGPVYLEQTEVTLKESDPEQVELVLIGNLPTPCHQLRVVSVEPDERAHFEIRAYSISDPDKTCAQVLEPFVAVVPLGDITEGTFTLSINDEIKGEFKLP